MKHFQFNIVELHNEYHATALTFCYRNFACQCTSCCKSLESTILIIDIIASFLVKFMTSSISLLMWGIGIKIFKDVLWMGVDYHYATIKTTSTPMH